ncbi:hypothetical protein J8M20_10485 [Pseudoalteromonas luteoviolacea]|uniref:hypothetical protein n=1 Tax=Pseudoalteromonas luteoviolacea TaxID=43657 RepID=UPI001B373E2C|nr:hypothetical protein [Pseudoalteromonas luteoviolacea]MBQ4811766.1 hypothetical protein [Pseudoalteromonas luteoviolacea]
MKRSNSFDDAKATSSQPPLQQGNALTLTRQKSMLSPLSQNLDGETVNQQSSGVDKENKMLHATLDEEINAQREVLAVKKKEMIEAANIFIKNNGNQKGSYLQALFNLCQQLFDRAANFKKTMDTDFKIKAQYLRQLKHTVQPAFEMITKLVVKSNEIRNQDSDAFRNHLLTHVSHQVDDLTNWNDNYHPKSGYICGIPEYIDLLGGEIPLPIIDLIGSFYHADFKIEDAKEYSSPSNRSITPDAPGKIRSWHLNGSGKLPVASLKITKGDVKRFIDNKKRPAVARYPLQTQFTNEWAKDMTNNRAFQNKIATTYQFDTIAEFHDHLRKLKFAANYIEINATGYTEGCTQGRLIYDFDNDRWYITPDHYLTVVELRVPDWFKKSQQGDVTAAKVTTTKAAGSKSSPINNNTIDWNNCLIEAIAENAGVNLTATNIQNIRNTLLDAPHSIPLGTMLWADTAVVQVILTELGLQGRTVILYYGNNMAQELNGGVGPVIEITNRGTLHFEPGAM